MKRETVWAVYFSPTGTTGKIVRHIARGIAAAWDSSFKELDFTLPGARAEAMAFSQEDMVIFGVPVYAGRVPNVLLKFLNTMEGGGALAAPVVLFGNRNYDDALIELRDLMEQRGFHTVAAAAFVGEHSFSRILGKGRPDASDLSIASSFADKIAALPMEGNPTGPVFVEGEVPIRPYYQPRDRQGNPIDIRKVKPKVKESCNACGLCAQVCSMGAIDPADVSSYINICIKCGSCIKKCPMGARYYDDENYLYHKQELEEVYTRRAEPHIF